MATNYWCLVCLRSSTCCVGHCQLPCLELDRRTLGASVICFPQEKAHFISHLANASSRWSLKQHNTTQERAPTQHQSDVASRMPRGCQRGASDARAIVHVHQISETHRDTLRASNMRRQKRQPSTALRRASKSPGFVQLKCEAELFDVAAPVNFRISIGSKETLQETGFTSSFTRSV